MRKHPGPGLNEQYVNGAELAQWDCAPNAWDTETHTAVEHVFLREQAPDDAATGVIDQAVASVAAQVRLPPPAVADEADLWSVGRGPWHRL